MGDKRGIPYSIGEAEILATDDSACPDQYIREVIQFLLDRDHCTPEERAVIDAAVKAHGQMDWTPDSEALDRAVSTLLTTRKEQGENRG